MATSLCKKVFGEASQTVKPQAVFYALLPPEMPPLYLRGGYQSPHFEDFIPITMCDGQGTLSGLLGAIVVGLLNA